MTDLEFRILIEFKREKVTSVSSLMRRYKLRIDAAQEMVDWLSSYSRKDEYNDQGKVERVFM